MVIHVSEMQGPGPNTSSRLRGAKNGCKYNARHGTNENKQTAHLFVDVPESWRVDYIDIYTYPVHVIRQIARYCAASAATRIEPRQPWSII